MNKGADDTAIKNSQSKARGARVSETTFAHEFSAWWRHHLNSCFDSLQRLLASPLQSLLTWMVIAIALALPVGLYLGLQKLQNLGDGWQDSAQMSVFLHRGAKDGAIEQFQNWLKSQDQVASFDKILPADALAEFQLSSGLSEVLSSLDENPLPTVFIVQPDSSVSSPEILSLLQTKIAANPVVDNVQLDLGWLRRLHELLSLGERMIIALAALLSLGVLLIIGNTMRLSIESRRDEIVVTKMVGGTNGFVRRPFLYAGFWYGLGGGLLALLLLTIIGFWLSAPVQRLLDLYGSEYLLTGFGFQLPILLLALSSMLGLLGAWIAVARHLKEIEPE